MNFSVTQISKHISFWLLYLLLWSLHDLNYNVNLLENVKNNLIPFLFYSILIYSNLLFFIPNFLLKRKVFIYLLVLSVGIVLITILTSNYLSFYFKIINESTANFFLSLRGKIAISTEVIISLCLSTTLFLIDEWYKKEQLINDLENQKLVFDTQNEKHQLNPHLLFNSLNNIYVKLDKKITEEQTKDFIFIKSNGMIIKIYIDMITFIETANDYVYINTTDNNRYLTLVSLKNIQKELPKDKFMRVHRYYLIGLQHVDKLEGNLLHIGKTKIKISRLLRNEVYTNIIGNKLIER